MNKLHLRYKLVFMKYKNTILDKMFKNLRLIHQWLTLQSKGRKTVSKKLVIVLKNQALFQLNLHTSMNRRSFLIRLGSIRMPTECRDRERSSCKIWPLYHLKQRIEEKLWIWQALKAKEDWYQVENKQFNPVLC